jgi:hypothetical protein
MIDNVSILLCIGAIGYVVMRSYVLNATLPWFGKGKALRAIIERKKR